MCWVNLSSTNTGNWREFINFNNNWGINTYSDGDTFNISGFNPNGPIMGSNIWYHTAATLQAISASSFNVFGYLNSNEAIGFSNTSRTFVNYTTVTIGNANDNGAYSSPLSGMIRDVRIFTRVMPVAEIKANMYSAVPINQAGLLLWAPLDTDLVNDKSGNGYVFTLGGSPILVAGQLQPYIKSNTMKWIV
jgi:hypothetical protein